MYLRKEKALEKLIAKEISPCVTHFYLDLEEVIWAIRPNDMGESEIFCIYIKWLPKKKIWYIEDWISEEEGPAALTCPLEFLKMASAEQFPEWREEVRKYHEGGHPVQRGDVIHNLANAIRKRIL